MATSFGKITVGQTATPIVASRPTRTGLVITNNADVDIAYGPDSSITFTTAPLLFAKTNFSEAGKMSWKGAIFGIVASGAADVRYWEWDES